MPMPKRPLFPRPGFREFVRDRAYGKAFVCAVTTTLRFSAKLFVVSAAISVFAILLSTFLIWAVLVWDERTNGLSRVLDLPDTAALHEFTFYEASEVAAADGRRIACFSSPEHRILVDRMEDLSPLVINAIIASEDQRFFEHHGVDWHGIVRAFLTNLGTRKKTSGASTLTMQIAKNLLLRDTSKTYKRKLKEIVLAMRIEREFTKTHLFITYVNMPYFGRGQYGIEAASRSYFGKAAKDLTLPEAAMVVGLINRPRLIERMGKSATEPPPEARRRARYVIERMAALDFISEEEADRAQSAIDHLRVSPVISGCSIDLIGPYFVEEVRRRYKERFPLNTGGLRFFLPIDVELQLVAERALREGIDVYRKRHAHDPDVDEIRAAAFGVDFAGRVRFMIGGEDYGKSQFNVITQGSRQPGSIWKAFTYAALTERLIESLLDDGVPPEDLFAKVQKRCVVLDAPIFISRGRGKPPKEIANFRTNTQPQYRGEISCRQALAESRNTAAIRAGQYAGIQHMIELAERLGIRNNDKFPLQPYPTTAIGASEVVPIDMIAYLAFANGGYRVKLTMEYDVCKRSANGTLQSVLRTVEGDPVDSSVRVPAPCNEKGVAPSPEAYERALHPVVAEYVRTLLMAVVDDPTGTAHALRRGVVPGLDPLGEEVWALSSDERKKRTIAFPIETSGEIAAKTGTATNDNGDTTDVWFVVMVPGPPERAEEGMLIVFWMGKTFKTNLGPKETGGRNLVPVAARVLQFLKERRGLLREGYLFAPIRPLTDVEAQFFRSEGRVLLEQTSEEVETVIDPSDPTTDPSLLQEVGRLGSDASSSNQKKD